MLKISLAASAVLLSAGALAADPGQPTARVNLYYVADTQGDLELADGTEIDGDGEGFGAQGSVLMIDKRMRLHGEYQVTELEDEIDVDTYRGGIGLMSRGPHSSGVVLEYVSAELDGLGQKIEGDGLGLHLRTDLDMGAGIRLHGQIGYLKLEDDDNVDADGLEFSLGMSYPLTKGVELFGDFRRTALENDLDDELDLTDLKLGVSLLFR